MQNRVGVQRGGVQLCRVGVQMGPWTPKGGGCANGGVGVQMGVQEWGWVCKSWGGGQGGGVGVQKGRVGVQMEGACEQGGGWACKMGGCEHMSVSGCANGAVDI